MFSSPQEAQRPDARTIQFLKPTKGRPSTCPLFMYGHSYRYLLPFLALVVVPAQLEHESSLLGTSPPGRLDRHWSTFGFVSFLIGARPSRTLLFVEGGQPNLPIDISYPIRSISSSKISMLLQVVSLDLPEASSQSDRSLSTRIRADNRPPAPRIPHLPSRTASPTSRLLRGRRSLNELPGRRLLGPLPFHFFPFLLLRLLRVLQRMHPLVAPSGTSKESREAIGGS